MRAVEGGNDAVCPFVSARRSVTERGIEKEREGVGGDKSMVASWEQNKRGRGRGQHVMKG